MFTVLHLLQQGHSLGQAYRNRHTKGLGYTPPVALTKSGSVLSPPGNNNYVLVSKGSCDYLVMTALLYNQLAMVL